METMRAVALDVHVDVAVEVGDVEQPLEVVGRDVALLLELGYRPRGPLAGGRGPGGLGVVRPRSPARRSRGGRVGRSPVIVAGGPSSGAPVGRHGSGRCSALVASVAGRRGSPSAGVVRSGAGAGGSGPRPVAGAAGRRSACRPAGRGPSAALDRSAAAGLPHWRWALLCRFGCWRAAAGTHKRRPVAGPVVPVLAARPCGLAAFPGVVRRRPGPGCCGSRRTAGPSTRGWW